MRVICGKYKGKRLFSPIGQSVRPTTDRIKETIFNILQNKMELEGKCVLDLFCGSGALGIEALSRGASEAVFVDKSPDSVALTKKNLAHVGAFFFDGKNGNKGNGSNSDNVEVYNADYRVALKKVGRRFDIIFLDPPYEKIDTDILINVKKYDVLAKGGIIILEHGSKNTLNINADGYIMDLRVFSDTSVAFLTLTDDSDSTKTEA